MCEVVEIGRSVVEPGDDVVDVATVEGHVAAGVGAGAVHRPQSTPLRPVRNPNLAAAFECFAVAVERDRHDRGFARQAAHRLRRQRDPVGGLAQRLLMQTVEQRFVVDVDADLRYPPLPGPLRRHRRNDRVGQQDVDRGAGVPVDLFDRRQLGVDR